MSGLDLAVLLVIHRRPDATRRVFDAIARARPKRLFVAADGPATEADRAACEAARAVIREVRWPCEVATDFCDENLGLDARVTSAIEWAFQSVEAAIVLEDDCIPADRFFGFAAEMVDRYRDDTRIVHVSGECYRARRPGDCSYFFSKYPLAWGWATWRRAWRSFDPALTTWPQFKQRPEAAALFDSDDERRYWERTFDLCHRSHAAGGPMSWDYAWYYACMAGGLSIHPAVNLVSNVGFDPHASHTAEPSPLEGRPAGELEEVLRHPASVVRDREADKDTFDLRFPGAILKQQRTFRHHAGRPGRWAARVLGIGRDRRRSEP